MTRSCMHEYSTNRHYIEILAPIYNIFYFNHPALSHFYVDNYLLIYCVFCMFADSSLSFLSEEH